MSDPTDRELQEYAARLARFRAISAPAGLRRDVRGALLAAPVVLRTPAGPSWIARLRPVLATLVIGAVLVGGAGSAAAGSLPGDPGFGLKRAVEEAQVAIAPDDTARLDLLVAQIDRRLSELETLASRRSASVSIATDEVVEAIDRLEELLTSVSAQPSTVARATAIARARLAAAAHVARLEALAPTLPQAAQNGIQRAIEAGQGIRGDGAPGRSKSPDPSRTGDAPGGGPGTSGGRPGNETAHPTPPTPTHR